MKSGKGYIFVVSRPTDAPTDLEWMINKLEALGVQVDREYGVTPLDPTAKSRFALRGTADADVIERLARNSSVEAFADPEVR